MAKTYNSLTVANAAAGSAILASDHAKAFENINNYRVPPMCRVYRNAALSHTSTGNFQAVSWDTESFTNTDGMWTVGDATKVYTKTAGVYLFVASLEFASNATGQRGVDIYLNGTTRIAYSFITNTGAGSGTALSITATYSCAATDYVELRPYQSSTANLAYSTGQVFHLSATWLGQVS